MTWNVKFYYKFDQEFNDLNEAIQDELLAHAVLLEKFGQLGRPHVDTLKGSKHANMKELRVRGDLLPPPNFFKINLKKLW